VLRHRRNKTELPAWVAAHPHVWLVGLRSPREVREYLQSLQ
jgi:hypothetical protein